MDTYNILIPMLVVFAQIYTMEQPEQPLITFEPKSLKELAAKKIVSTKNFISQFALPNNNPDIDECIEKQFSVWMHTQLTPDIQEAHAVMSTVYNSECKFLSDAKRAICYQKNPLRIKVFDAENFLKKPDETEPLKEFTTMEYGSPIFQRSSADPKCRGILYVAHKKLLNAYNIMEEKQDEFTLKYVDVHLEQKLPGRVNLITKYGNGFAVTVMSRKRNKPQCIYNLSKEGKVALLAHYYNRKRIMALQEGPNDTLVILFRDRTHEMFDPKTNIHTSLPLNPPSFKPGFVSHTQSLAVSPDKQIICVGFGEGTLIAYNIFTHELVFFPDSEYRFGPITFLDSRLFAVSRTKKAILPHDKPVMTEIWHAGLALPLAYFNQEETNYCNSIDIDQNTLLFGMGHHDVTIETIDSFRINPYLIDWQKLCKTPKALYEFFQKERKTFRDKIELIVHYAKEPKVIDAV